jgi:predicted trehalose synthase
MRSRVRWLFALVALCLLAGCATTRSSAPTTAAVIGEFQRAMAAGRQFYQSQSTVQYGMTAADIYARFGDPVTIEASQEGVLWAYAVNRREVLLLWFEQGIYVETVLTTREALRRVGQWGRRLQTQ